MNEPTKRPWYSFRWQTLFWIALPFIWVTLAGLAASLLASLISVFSGR